MKYDYYNSPIGSLLLAGDDSGLQFIGFPEGKGHLEPAADWIRDGQPFATVQAQLAEYFSGDRTEFDLLLHSPGTALLLPLLQALQSLPYDDHRSYYDISWHP